MSDAPAPAPALRPVHGTEYGVRAMEGDEFALMFSTWLKSAQSSKTKEQLSADTRIYFRMHHQAICNFMARKNARIEAIVHLEVPETILGWIAWEKRGGAHVVHFVFVKSAYRRQGVARALFEGTLGLGWKTKAVDYTHKLTRSSRAEDGTLPPIPPTWVHNAYPFFMGE